MGKPSSAESSTSVGGIVVGLIALHYGMGFILGGGEQTYLHGASGAVYALTAALGLIGLCMFAGFYWRSREPIWNLLGNQYGETVRHLTNSLSWVWMVGVMAGQLVGAGYALSIFGVPASTAMILIAIAIAILGPIPLDRIKWLFTGLLVISTFALILSLERLGGVLTYRESIGSFFPSFFHASPFQTIGIAFTTFLLTLIGMDFQKVLVTARTDVAAIRGSLFAGLSLIPVAFLPTAVVLGALKHDIISIGTINGKDAIPQVLFVIGNQIFSGGGLVLVVSLVLAAIGSGSGLNRALIGSIEDASFMPSKLRHPRAASWINAALALGIAFSGLTIVGLMVSFYAIYVAGVFIPFMAYLVQQRYGLKISPLAISQSTWVGSGIATLILIVGLILRASKSSVFNWVASAPEIWMISIGMIVSMLLLVTSVVRNRQNI